MLQIWESFILPNGIGVDNGVDGVGDVDGVVVDGVVCERPKTIPRTTPVSINIIANDMAATFFTM